MRSLREVERQLAAPWSAVLVDCFGTLLHRRVPARRVQQLAAEELGPGLAPPVDPSLLLAEWRRLERELAHEPGRAGNGGGARDAPVPELAVHLHAALPGSDERDEEAFVTAFCDAVVAVEVAATEPDRDLWSRLGRLPPAVRRIVVSDTGLTEPMLRSLLAAHGLDDSDVTIVASSAHGTTKRSGGLYAFVIEGLGVDPTTAVMIGDDERSDRRRAAEAGLATVLVRGGRWDGTKDAGDDELRRDLEQRIDGVLRADRGAVFPELSLTLWLFTARLDAALRSLDASRAVFLAREGRFLRELYDGFDRRRAHPGRSPLPTSYLLTSRKSTSSGDEEQEVLLRELVREAAPEAGPLHLVDVGWKGTVRDRIAALDPGRVVHGHLLGLVLSGATDPPAHTRGHLFANRPRRTPYFQIFSHFKGLYELLLSADHGSVASYGRGDDGRVGARFDESPAERRCHDEIVAPWQAVTAARFAEIDRILRVVRGEPAWLTDLVARHHARMVYRPTRQELDAVEGLVQYENFGSVGVRVAGEAPEGGKGRGLRRHVSGGGWPPLRMRRAGVGWQRIPYGVVKTVQLRAGRLR